ncbi:unnamed protein product [Anisakis simplex]|uniref:PE family protein n=1 Tax=Anisakis simplex TaxID=6269 RepID=A0A0M3KEF0_ANISI|nr:unnamed protein product [Anisakis simplex]
MRGGRGGHGLGRGTAVRSATGSATSSTSTNRQAVGSAGRGGG